MNAHHLYAVAEASADPYGIPPHPVSVPMADREFTDAVYRGPVDTANLIGFVREDYSTGDVVARTRGNADFAANVKRFTQRSEALSWLARAIDGVIPRKTYGRLALRLDSN